MWCLFGVSYWIMRRLDNSSVCLVFFLSTQYYQFGWLVFFSVARCRPLITAHDVHPELVTCNTYIISIPHISLSLGASPEAMICYEKCANQLTLRLTHKSIIVARRRIECSSGFRHHQWRFIAWTRRGNIMIERQNRKKTVHRQTDRLLTDW